MSNEQKEALKIISKLLEDPYNQICADCQCKPSKWASTTLGVFICIDCSGVHRSLGTHISFVRSCTLDSWSMDQVRLMEAIGNRLGNSYWEAKLPTDFERPGNSNRSLMQNFIKEKYQLKKWADEGPPPHIVYKHLLQKQLLNSINSPNASNGRNSHRGHSKSRNSGSSRHSRTRQNEKNDKKELQFHRTETTEPQIQVTPQQPPPVVDPKKPLDDFFMEQPKRFVPKPYIPHKKVVYDMPKEEPDYEKMAPDEIDKFFDQSNEDEDTENSTRKNSLEKAMLSRIQTIFQNESQNNRKHYRRHDEEVDYDYYNEEEEDTTKNQLDPFDDNGETKKQFDPFDDNEETNTANLEAFFDKQKPKNESKKSIILPKTVKQPTEIETEQKETEIIEETPIQSHPIDNINLDFQFLPTNEGDQIEKDNNANQFWEDESNSENEIQLPDINKLKDIQLEGKALSHSPIMNEPNKDNSLIKIDKVDPEDAIQSYNPFASDELNGSENTFSLVQQLQQNSNQNSHESNDIQINDEKVDSNQNQNDNLIQLNQIENNELNQNEIKTPNNDVSPKGNQTELIQIDIQKENNEINKNEINKEKSEFNQNEVKKEINESNQNEIQTGNDIQISQNEIKNEAIVQNVKSTSESNNNICYYPNRPTKLTISEVNSMSFIPPGETIEDEMIDDFFAEAEQLIQTPNSNKNASKKPHRTTSRRHTRSRRHNYSDYDYEYDNDTIEQEKPSSRRDPVNSTRIQQTPIELPVGPMQKSAFAPPPARKPGAHIPARLQKKIEVVQEKPRKRRHHRSRRPDNF